MKPALLEMFLYFCAVTAHSGDIMFDIMFVESKNCKEYDINEIYKFCYDATEKAEFIGPLQENDYRYKFCLFVHFFENESGENEMLFYYINTDEDGNPQIDSSTSFNGNFNSPFLGIPFITNDEITDYLINIKEYMSDTERVIRDYRIIKELGKNHIPESKKIQIIKDHEKLTNENASLKEENTQFKEEITSLKDENTSLKNENVSLKEENNQFKEEITSLKEENKLFKEEHDQFKEEISSLKDENKLFKEEISSLKDENASLKDENKHVKEEITTMKQGFIDLKEYCKNLENELNKLKKVNNISLEAVEDI